MSIDIESGIWMGAIDLVVATMYDFKVFIGMQFTRENKVVLVLFINTLGMLREYPCFLPSFSYQSWNEEKLLFAIQLKKGICRKEATYLVLTRPIKPDTPKYGVVPPLQMQHILNDFTDDAYWTTKHITSKKGYWPLDWTGRCQTPNKKFIQNDSTRSGRAQEADRGTTRKLIHLVFEGAIWCSFVVLT